MKEEEKIYKVYIHTCLINLKVYIGITSLKPEDRWQNGNGYRKNKHFFSAIKKYGWENFKHIILFDRLTESEAQKIEVELISYHNSNNSEYGYNKTSGGEKQKKYTDEVREKMRKHRIGKKLSKETRMKITGSNNKKSKKIICIETGVIYDSIRIAEKETGIDHSGISKVCLKKLNTINGLHFCFLNDYRDDLELLSPNFQKTTKRVVCLDTLEIFNSINDCARKLNLRASGISKVCHGQIKTTGGYKFEFYE